MASISVLEPTEDYQHGVRADQRPDRVPVPIVVGSAPSTNADLYPLLRRRLLLLAMIIAIALLVSFVLISVLPPVVEHSNQIALRWRAILNLTVAAACAAVLWVRPPATVGGLRAIEGFLFGVPAILAASASVDSMNYGPLFLAKDLPLPLTRIHVDRYVLATSLLWFIILTSYGALIPNSWRRSLLVCGIAAASPVIVFATFAYWVQPIPAGMANEVLAGLVFYNALAVAIVVFASSRMEVFRRQAVEARRLGQYVLRERIGGGGMGQVYRAEHLLLRRPCALKVIRPERAGDPANLRRFEREVQTTATLTHPNTVQVYDYGRAQDGTFYYVMEYLAGRTLEALVAQEGPLAPRRAVHLLRQVCGALQEAHRLDLIHRDVKPGNVMVAERGGIPDFVKLLDFGLVLPPLDVSDPERLSRDGVSAGTPAYMSPEQIDGTGMLDGRSDVYAVGALGYFLLTGSPPFAGLSGAKTLAAHLYEKPLPPSSRRAGIPAALDAVILRCLEKERSDRYPDCGSLAAALESLSDDAALAPSVRT